MFFLRAGKYKEMKHVRVESLVVRERILVIAPNWIGDAIMAQSLLRCLRMKYPSVAIEVLACSWVAPLIRAMAEVDIVIESDLKHGSIKILDFWRYALFLRRRRYSEAYVLPNTIKYALLPWLAGIKRRIGYRGESRYGLINVMHHDSKIKPRPMAQFYAALADHPNSALPDQPPRPSLNTCSMKRAEVFRQFALSEYRSLIAFVPGAEFGSAKTWSSNNFGALAKKILHAYPTSQIVVLGSNKDIRIGQVINSVCGDVINLAGKTSLQQAIFLLSGADAVVGNDTGLIHIASALNRPVVGIYGPTDPSHAPPLSEKSSAISLRLTCSPCRQRECPLLHRDCMNNIDSESVWIQLKEFLPKK